MNESIHVLTQEIHPNPYQPRLAEDPAAIEELAASILRDGLMQVPTGRAVDGHYELAFGHSRLAAFKLLASRGADGQPTGFEKMPLIVRELTDLQMFDLAIGENIKRRNLNVVELATAQKRYMEQFGKTSEEAGALFGVSAETVRGNVRLLNLPAEVQAKLASGELTIGAARALLVVQRIAPEALQEAVDELLDKDNYGIHDSPEDAVAYVLGQQKTVKQLYHTESPFTDVAPKKFPFKHLKKVTPQQALHLLGLTAKNIATSTMAEILQLLELGTEQAEIFSWLKAEEKEKLTVLVAPPQCTQCPMMAKLDGHEFCGMIMCWERKSRAWKEGQIEAVSKKTSIPIYDPAKDGEAKVVLSSWEDKDRKLFEKKGEDLRLVRNDSYNASFTGLERGVAVVAVGKTAEKRLNADVQSGRTGRYAGDTFTDEQKEEIRKAQERRQQNEIRIARFAWEVATPAFFPAIEGIKSFEVLRSLVEIMEPYNDWTAHVPDYPPYFSDELWAKIAKQKPATRMQTVRSWLLFTMIYREGEIPDENNKKISKKYVETYGQALQKLAEEWGVKLPKNWLEKAAEYDAMEIVTEGTAQPGV